MKNFTLLSLLFLFCNLVMAQEEISFDRYVVGGSMNFTVEKNSFPTYFNWNIVGVNTIREDVRNTIFSISPYLGKELNPNWILGIQSDYRITSLKVEDVNVFNQPERVTLIRSSDQIGFGLFARYTFTPDKAFNFFLQPQVDYNLFSEEETQDSEVTQEETANFLQLGVGAGILYNINQRWRLLLRTAGIQYITGTWEDVDANTKRNFSSFNSSIRFSSIFFGLEMRF